MDFLRTILRALLHRFPRWAGGAVLLAVATIGLSSCKSAQPIRIGISAFPSYELLYLAQEKGFYRAEGVDVQIVEFASLADVGFALRNQQIDGAATTAVDLALAVARDNLALKAVSVLNYSAGADAIIARAPIQKISELRGKRVGFEGDSLGAVVLGQALDRSGLDWPDIVPVMLDQPHGRITLENGEIDALVTYAPYSTVLTRNPAMQSIFDSKSLPGEILDVLVFSVETLQTRRDDVMRIQRALQRTIDFAGEHPDDAIPLMAAREGLGSSEFKEVLQHQLILVNAWEQPAYLSPGGHLEKSLTAAMDDLHALGLIQRRGAANVERMIEFAAAMPAQSGR